jgi:hypothetical protein
MHSTEEKLRLKRLELKNARRSGVGAHAAPATQQFILKLYQIVREALNTAILGEVVDSKGGPSSSMPTDPLAYTG